MFKYCPRVIYFSNFCSFIIQSSVTHRPKNRLSGESKKISIASFRLQNFKKFKSRLQNVTTRCLLPPKELLILKFYSNAYSKGELYGQFKFKISHLFQTCQRPDRVSGLQRRLHKLRSRGPCVLDQHGRRSSNSLNYGLQVRIPMSYCIAQFHVIIKRRCPLKMLGF
jgi:hypothetical protein